MSRKQCELAEGVVTNLVQVSCNYALESAT